MATASPATVSSGPPRPAVRAVVSVLVILHVAAVFIGPWAMPPQNSELSATVARLFQPYLDILSLGNGYRFFAPEPGPSHLVRYEVTLDDGTLVEGVFPDRSEHRPRLLYHRYFMLSEFVNTLSGGNRENPRADAYAGGYARHLAEQYNAKTVKLFLRRHYVPRTEEVQRGMRLTDKALYEERPLFTYHSD
ncbi:MAG: hypothetical protein WD063_15920 [Pirellulales bacterium]